MIKLNDHCTKIVYVCVCPQLIPQISSLSWFTTAVPLVFVLSISAVKDANDDIVSRNSKNWKQN